MKRQHVIRTVTRTEYKARGQLVIDGGKAYRRISLAAGAHKTISRNRSHKVSPNCHKFLSQYRALQRSSNFQPFPLKPSSTLEYGELLRGAPVRGSIHGSIQTKIIFYGTVVIVGGPSNSNCISGA